MLRSQAGAKTDARLYVEVFVRVEICGANKKKSYHGGSETLRSKERNINTELTEDTEEEKNEMRCARLFYLCDNLLCELCVASPFPPFFLGAIGAPITDRCQVRRLSGRPGHPQTGWADG